MVVRVGFWRLKRVLDRRNIPGFHHQPQRFALKSSILSPGRHRESLDSGWELPGRWSYIRKGMKALVLAHAGASIDAGI